MVGELECPRFPTLDESNEDIEDVERQGPKICARNGWAREYSVGGEGTWIARR